MKSTHLIRSWLLYSQSRYDLAEQELRQHLAGDPDDAEAHSLLALCLSERKEFQAATDEARAAVHLAPDLPLAHSALARVCFERNHLPEAVAAVREALRLDPSSVSDYALLAQLQFSLRDWPGALAAAEQGLHLDAEHVGCNNLRAMALVKLGRKQEASLTIESTLARDPEDATSHANLGWTCLEKGDPAKALESFREALRLDPELDWARAGIVEALKARHFVYRVMLWYFLAMAKLGGGAQWMIILGGYFGYRMLSSLAEQNPGWAPLLWPVLAAYVVFAWMTWLADPLFNLLLRLNRFGRLTLSREQMVGSNLIGGLLLLTLLALGAWALTQSFLFLIVAGYFGLLMLPTSMVFKVPSGWPRRWMACYTALVALAGMAGFGFLFSRQLDTMVTAINVFSWGVFLSAFVANGLASAQVRN